MSVRSGTPRSGMFTDVRAVPVSKSMTDGTPMPTASAGPAACTAVTSWSTSACAPSTRVRSMTGSDRRSPSSTATEIFVPPTSTPIRRSVTALTLS